MATLYNPENKVWDAKLTEQSNMHTKIYNKMHTKMLKQIIQNSFTRLYNTLEETLASVDLA
jgi:hypothetical protein